MKRKIYIIIILFIILFKTEAVNASTLQREFIDNIWSFHYRNGKVWTYGQLNIKHIDGKIGYCIEPDSAINTEEYMDTENWKKSGYSDEEKKQMELYAYYGYHYPGHNTIKYYMATQELIWLLSSDEKIRWTTEDHSDSEEINIEPEKQEILNLISKHSIFPSFTSYKHGKLGTTLVLNDENEVLEFYDIFPGKAEGNKFMIDITPEIQRVHVARKKFLYDKTILYYSYIKSQKIATFGNPPSNLVIFNVLPDKTTVTINKKDKQTLQKILSDGTKIKITNLATKDEIEEEFNNGTINTTLLPGEYSIEELSASKGYLLNNECTKITVGDDPLSIDYFNEPAMGKIKVKKLNANNEYIEGCKFDIYDSNNVIVDTVITTKDEYDESKYLPLGEYLVKESEAPYGYKIDNKSYKIKLEYKNQYENVYEELDLINEKKKCKTTIIGIDENNNEIKISFNIYDKNNNLVYSGNKSELDLEYGDYYIVETKVENGYILNKDKTEFSVNDNSCGVKIKLLNKKVNMPITSTKNMSFLALTILILNFGIYKIIKKYL